MPAHGKSLETYTQRSAVQLTLAIRSNGPSNSYVIIYTYSSHLSRYKYPDRFLLLIYTAPLRRLYAEPRNQDTLSAINQVPIPVNTITSLATGTLVAAPAVKGCCDVVGATPLLVVLLVPVAVAVALLAASVLPNADMMAAATSPLLCVPAAWLYSNVVAPTTMSVEPKEIAVPLTVTAGAPSEMVMLPATITAELSRFRGSLLIVMAVADGML